MIAMKYYLFFIVIITVMSFKSMANIRNPHERGICHVEAEYFYPGIWEKYGENSCQYDYDKNAEYSLLF